MKRLGFICMIVVALTFGLAGCTTAPAPDDPGTDNPDSPDNPDNPDNPDDPDKSDTPDFPFADADVIFYDSFDKVEAGGDYPWLNVEWQVYSDARGSGASGVSYDASYVTLRSNFISQGYPGASGLNNAYFNDRDSWLVIKDVNLPSDRRQYKLAVGFNNPEGDHSVTPGSSFHIFVSGGSKKFELEWTAVQYDAWVYVTSDFEVVSYGTTALSFWIETGIAKLRMDDFAFVVTKDAPSASLNFADAPDPGDPDDPDDPDNPDNPDDPDPDGMVIEDFKDNQGNW